MRPAAGSFLQVLLIPSGATAAPVAVRTLMPLSEGGLWLAVTITPPAAERFGMLYAHAGVGTGPFRNESAYSIPGQNLTHRPGEPVRPEPCVETDYDPVFGLPSFPGVVGYALGDQPDVCKCVFIADRRPPAIGPEPRDPRNVIQRHGGRSVAGDGPVILTSPRFEFIRRTERMISAHAALNTVSRA